MREELASVEYCMASLGECKIDGVHNGLSFDRGRLKGHLQLKGSSVSERYYYAYTDQNGQQIAKSFGTSTDPRVIRFKQFKYNEVLRSILKKNRRLLKRFIRAVEKSHYRYDPEAIDALLKPINVDHTGLVNKCPGVSSPGDWLKMPYEANGVELDKNRTHRTCDGTRVRSKGEVIIYNTLKMLGVPFRYEQTIRLVDENGMTVKRVPDFVILKPDGTEVILEYLGKIDDDEYLMDNLRKIQLYRRNGYDLGKNLFIIGDSYGGWIDSEQIVKTIELIMA